MGIDWPQPDCEGTMQVARDGGGGSCFVLAAPFGAGRANMTISHSCGDTPSKWVHDQVLWPGPSAYSAMDVSMDGGSIYVMYERGQKGPYEEIHFTEIRAPRAA